MNGTLSPVVDRLDPSVFPWPELGGDVAFVDIETSGGTNDATRIIEVGVVRITPNGRVRRFASLVNPEGPVVTTFVHGLHPEDLEVAPTFRDLWPRLAAWLDDALLVAHKADFERANFERELVRLGGRFGAPMLCTLKLARRLHPDRAGRGAHSLAGLQELYGLDPSGHEALADAESLAVLFSRWCATDERVAEAVAELVETAPVDWTWPDLPGPGAEPVRRRPEALLPLPSLARRWLLAAGLIVLGGAALWGYVLAH